MDNKFPLKITWELNQCCNLDCKICYSIDKKSENPNGLEYEKCEKIIEKLHSLDVLYVFFSGGEPLLKERFYELLPLCTSYFCTWIQTNGTMIGGEEARKIAKARVNTVFVNLHGHNVEVHECYTRTPNSFKKAITGIQHLVKEGVNVMSTIILTKNNFLYTEEYVRLCKDIGVSKINILRGYFFNNPEAKKLLELSHRENQYAINTMKSACDKYGIKLGHSYGERNHNCCPQAISIDANGILQNCPYIAKLSKLGSFLNDDPIKLWNSDSSMMIRESYLKSPSECVECNNYGYCKGGCTANKYMESQRFDIKDPVCWL